MMMYLLLQFALLAVAIAIVVRVWRASALDGVLCLIVPLYVLVPMIKHWKNPDHDIRFHVALLFAGAIGAVWMQYHFAQEILTEQTAARTALRSAPADQQAEALADQAFESDDDDNGTPTDTRRPQATIELGRKARALGGDAVASDTAPPQPAAPVSLEPAAAPREEARAAPLTLRQALALATFQRGTFDRSTIGFAIDVPEHFHLLSAGDARRIEASQGTPGDAREIAWVTQENMPLDSPGAWHVTVRWLSDGWVAANGEFDAWRLLQQAQTGAAAKRLAGSGGELIGFAVAPSYSGGIADWVEERLPQAATASVLDCHAVRLGRKGVVEFSVVGAAPGSQALCNANVSLLARSTRFEAGADYSPAAVDAPRASYTLAQLVAGVR